MWPHLPIGSQCFLVNPLKHRIRFKRQFRSIKVDFQVSWVRLPVARQLPRRQAYEVPPEHATNQTQSILMIPYKPIRQPRELPNHPNLIKLSIYRVVLLADVEEGLGEGGWRRGRVEEPKTDK